MSRTTPAAVLMLLLGAASLPPATAQEGPPEVPDHLRAYSIFPPGQEGNVTAQELAEGSFGPHYDQFLERYAGLVDDAVITEAELPGYFHSMQFGIGEDETIESTYSPTAGVTVYRDSEGIPHIYGDSLETASFALGYTTAEDRMWQMDVFRHAARGTLAELVGAGTDRAYIDMDIATRRDGYTDAEMTAMFDALDDKFGALGTQVQEGLTAYANGVNAYIDELKTTRLDELAVEYAATGNPFPEHPRPWVPNDTLFLVVLQLRVFGEIGGQELSNAAVLGDLEDRLGRKLGGKVFEDLFFAEDPRPAITIPASEGSFPDQNLGKLDPDSVAIPDQAEAMARREARERALRRKVLGAMGFRSPASNMLVVAPDESKTGNTLHFGAPQVGYANPSFFVEVDVHAPGADFRGPAVPGASALIPLGRGTDYAWSLTTGNTDNVDVRAELLCDPAGGDPTLDSTGYLFDGECVEMESRDETFIIKPQPVDPGPPGLETQTIHRTVHGPVFDTGTVDGAPVAFVRQRPFWMLEIDSIASFLEWNIDVGSVEEFIAAAEDFTMTFNAFYADATDIGYAHVGYFPRRARGTSSVLPTWGTGEWEWDGILPFSQHPQIVNPEQGWLANWNNQPAKGWGNGDDPNWGPVQRVRLLQDAMGALLKGAKKASLSDVVQVIADAATRDVNAVYLGNRMTRWALGAKLGKDAKKAARIVKSWVADGANRTNTERDDTMDRGNALAIFDAWWETLVHRVFDDELGPAFFDSGRVSVTSYSPTTGSSFGFGFKDYLERAFHRPTSRTLARDYCDTRGTKRKETCSAQVVAALKAAVKQLISDQGADLAAWTTPAENIVFANQGAGSVEPIPWQNRGTHNHAVEVVGSS